MQVMVTACRRVARSVASASVHHAKWLAVPVGIRDNSNTASRYQCRRLPAVARNETLRSIDANSTLTPLAVSHGTPLPGSVRDENDPMIARSRLVARDRFADVEPTARPAVKPALTRVSTCSLLICKLVTAHRANGRNNVSYSAQTDQHHHNRYGGRNRHLRHHRTRNDRRSLEAGSGQRKSRPASRTRRQSGRTATQDTCGRRSFKHALAIHRLSNYDLLGA